MNVLGLVDVPIWLMLILALVFTVVMYTWRKRSTFDRLGFKTKPSTFLLGDLIQMGKQGFSIYDLDMLKKYGKLFGTFLGNKPVLIISDADMVKQICVKEFHNFTERGIFDFPSKPRGIEGVQIAEGAHWKFLRSSLSPCFTTGKMRQMQTRIRRSLNQFHSNLQERISSSPEGLDVIPIFRGFTLDVICSTGFSMDVDSIRDPDNAFVKNAIVLNNSQFSVHPVAVLNLFFPGLPGLGLIKFDPLPLGPLGFFREAAERLYEERKGEDSDFPDLLHTMKSSTKQETLETGEVDTNTGKVVGEIKQQGLTDEDILVNSVIFMLAGFETTAVTLTWLCYDMAVNPDCQEKVWREIENEMGQDAPSYDNVSKLPYLDMVFMETMRFHPGAQFNTRKAKEDMDICGVTIPKDMSLLFSAHILHFMEEYWDEPMLYKPERFAPENKSSWNEYAYMPFGIGPRNCIGKRLAVLEVKMTMVSILQKYRILPTDQLQVPMPADSKTFHRPAHPVVVKLESRT